MLKFLGCLLTLIISPGKGWDNIAENNEDVNVLLGKGFYPLIGFTSLTAFIRYFYQIRPDFISLIDDVIITFITYIVSYFLASFLFSFFLKKNTVSEVPERRYNTFIIYNLSLLSLINIIENCLSVTLSIVEFFPIFVILVMWMGNRFLDIKEGSGVSFIIFSTLSVLVPPYVFKYLFSLFLN